MPWVLSESGIYFTFAVWSENKKEAAMIDASYENILTHFYSFLCVFSTTVSRERVKSLVVMQNLKFNSSNKRAAWSCPLMA